MAEAGAWRTAPICTAEHRGSVGVANSTSTIKYKLSAGKPWFPYAILEQFRRVANIYYLVVSALMVVGEQAPQLWVTPYESWSTAGVLAFVLVLTAIKEGYEDIRRLRSDRAENNTLVLARAPKKGMMRWADLRVGDLVIVRDHEAMPADAVLLTSSAPNGIAYVDTANIDGETNLKLREPPLEVAQALGADEDAEVVGSVSVEPPSRHIHSFNGAIRLDRPTATATNGHGSAENPEHPLTASSLLLRGSIVRNVEFALAVVVYTGSESKVAMNSQETPSKMSLVEKTINTSLGAIMVPYLAFTTVSAAVASGTEYLTPYLLDKDANALVLPPFVSSWVTFFILYCFLIPISLYVTIELVNLLQAYLITQDAQMYDPTSNTPAVARSSNLCQELGQVQYVFSDKTGTLTANEMVLRYLSIGSQDLIASLPPPAPAAVAAGPPLAGAAAPAAVPRGAPHKLGHEQQQRERERARAFATDVDEEDSASAGPAPPGMAFLAQPAARASAGAPGSAAGTHDDERSAGAGSDALRVASIPLENLLRLGGGRPGGVSASPRDASAASSGVPRLSFSSDSGETLRARTAAELLSVCHTVLPQLVHGALVYQGESPDEVALVDAAASVGYRLIRRDGDEVVVAVGAAAAARPAQGWAGTCPDGCDKLSVRVLAVNQFNSTRKRMSCLVKYPDGSIVLYAKGADTNMLPLLDARSMSPAEAQRARDHLSAYAREGLRTLVLAKRVLTAQQASEWLARFKAAAVARTDRDGQLAAAAAAIETGLSLVGLTAIEDKLQVGVPHTLEHLRRAGLKVWVLTGDKVETAVNIGFSCRLLTPEMTLLYVGATADGDQEPATTDSLREQLRSLTAHYADQILAQLPHLAAPAAGSTTDGMSAADRLADRLTHSTARPPTSGLRAVFGRLQELQQSASHTIATRLFLGAPSSSKAAEVEAATLALVVDGAALALVLEDEGLKEALLHLGRICASVLACRVSPKQKAQVVELVRKGVKPEPLTLAIGDGANDVGMIQSAHVGVGISGKEGMQAVNNSDFAIAQFRFLERLLLLHGRWNYTRMSKVVLYYYYKNFVLTLTLFVFNFQTAFSGTSLFESLMASGYNVVLFLPIVIVGALDQDISSAMVLRQPELYVTGRTNMHLNTPKVAATMFQGVLTGGVIVAVAAATRRSSANDSLQSLGATVYSWLFLIMQWKLVMEASHWSRPMLVVWWAHNILFFVFLVVYSYMLSVSPDFYGVGVNTINEAEFWLACIVVVGASIGLDITLEFVRLQFRPTVVDIYAEIDRGYGDDSIEGAIRAQGALGRLREALGIFSAPSHLKRPRDASNEFGATAPPPGAGRVQAGADRSSYDFTAPEMALSKRAELMNKTLEGRASNRVSGVPPPPPLPTGSMPPTAPSSARRSA